MRKCSVKVYPAERYGSFKCQKGATVERDGKWYCGIHDPEKRKEREEKREIKYKQEREWENAKYKCKQEQDARNAVLNQFCDSVSTEDIAKLLTATNPLTLKTVLILAQVDGWS